MKAITVTPRKKDTLGLVELDVPVPGDGEVLLEVQRVGICGTDRDIIAGFYGEAPAGSDSLVLGHESLCRVSALGSGVEGFSKGDLVVPTVRRDCPEECASCRNGESDMCLTGDYKEHGIKGLHGFAREFAVSDARFVVKLPESLLDVGVLTEPLTIVEKGVFQSYAIQGSRLKWQPQKALVLGAGPVGLLATAVLRLRGLDVETAATRSEESLKARLVEETGARYLNVKTTPLSTLEHKYDLVLEITGNTAVASQSQSLIGVNGVLSLLGIYREETVSSDAGRLFTDLVLGNKVVFGSVNANRSYFEMGAKDLVQIQKRWPGFLEKVITRRERPENYGRAYQPEDREEIKTVVEFKE